MRTRNRQRLNYEVCVACQSVVGFSEAQENAEWLLEESDYTLDEGPHCGSCARKRRANLHYSDELGWVTIPE